MAYQIDFAVSKRFADLIDAKPRECYSNSIKALVVAARQVGEKNVFYCEGYAASSELMIPIHHGWLEMTIDEKTVIVDPTWCNKNETLVYKSIIKMSESDVSQLFKRRKSIKTPVTDFYTEYLVNIGILKRTTANEFMEMLNEFHRELNEATKTIGD